MKSIIGIISFVLIFNLGFAQERTLLTIDDRPISETEFIRIYKKNNSTGNVVDKKSVEEYLDLFINFKLKVIEAESRGMDTLEKFQKELKGYKRQLERPYFTDKVTEDYLLKEAFERSLYDVRASHILLMVSGDATPADTLAAYNKISKMRQQLINGKVSFDKLAVSKSEDPSAKQNKGDLGYFTVFQMVYPFENAAYNTPVGKISEIVRTRYGYHILKVTDKRKSQGEVKVAHIMVGVPKDASKENVQKAEEKIKMIHHKLKEGGKFGELAHLYSDDKGSAKNGGELNWFGMNHMVKPFEEASFALKNKGDISEPVKTRFGWHIIKLIDKKEPGTFEKRKKSLQKRISSDMRSRVSKAAVYERIKKEYNYQLNEKNLKAFYKAINKDIFEGKWDKKQVAKLNKTLFVLNDSAYNQQLFVDFLEKNTLRKRSEKSVEDFVNKMFRLYEERELKEMERAHLSEKYPEYKYLLQEYHDGILLFDLTDKEVWTKAIEDSIGLGNFYEANKQNYKWGKRVEASVYEYKDKKVLKKLKKLLAKQSKKGYSVENILSIVNKKEDSAADFIKADTFSKNDYKLVDLANQELNFFDQEVKTPLSFTKDNKLVFISKVIPETPKKMEETKGQVTADYQDYLEKEWVKQLRKKYKIVINEDVWKEVKSKH